MFDLEQAIAEWQRQMAAGGITGKDRLDELESHLREEIEQRIRAGRPEAEAFAASVDQIGPPATVEAEFSKIDGARERLEWKRTEISFGLLSTLLPLWIIYRLVLHSQYGTFASASPALQASAIAAVAAFALLAWGGRLGCRALPVIRDKHRRGIATILCAAPVAFWWVVFLRVIVPHHDYLIGQFVVTFLWAFLTPGGAVIGLVWGLNAAARKHNQKGAKERYV